MMDFTKFLQLPDNWGGSERPSRFAAAIAWSLSTAMKGHGYDVLRAAPMADGGVSVRYLEGHRSARFDVYNEGGIVVATRVGHGDSFGYAELSEADAVVVMVRFLNVDRVPHT